MSIINLWSVYTLVRYSDCVIIHLVSLRVLMIASIFFWGNKYFILISLILKEKKEIICMPYAVLGARVPADISRGN